MTLAPSTRYEVTFTRSNENSPQVKTEVVYTRDGYEAAEKIARRRLLNEGYALLWFDGQAVVIEAPKGQP